MKVNFCSVLPHSIIIATITPSLNNARNWLDTCEGTFQQKYSWSTSFILFNWIRLLKWTTSYYLRDSIKMLHKYTLTVTTAKPQSSTKCGIVQNNICNMLRKNTWSSHMVSKLLETLVVIRKKNLLIKWWKDWLVVMTKSKVLEWFNCMQRPGGYLVGMAGIRRYHLRSSDVRKVGFRFQSVSLSLI